MIQFWLPLTSLLIACTTDKDSAEPELETPQEVEGDEDTEQDDTEQDTDDTEVYLDFDPGINTITLEQDVEGEVVERSFLVHLPDDFDGTGSTPLLFAFHGNGGTGDDFIGQFGPPVANREFVGVYPNGIDNSWNIEREDSKADDVAFTAMILDALEMSPGIDTSKPVALGNSNGAALIHKMAMESDRFVAIVPQVSHLLVANQPQTNGAKISVMQFSGTVDDLVPYDGGVGILGYEFMPAEDSTAAWATHNGCDETSAETDIGEHVKFEWLNCEKRRSN